MPYKYPLLPNCRVSEEVVAQLRKLIGDEVTVSYRQASTRYNITGKLANVSNGYIQVGHEILTFDGREGMYDDDFGGIISIWKDGTKIFRNPNMQERLIEDKIRLRENLRRLARSDDSTTRRYF